MRVRECGSSAQVWRLDLPFHPPTGASRRKASMARRILVHAKLPPVSPRPERRSARPAAKPIASSPCRFNSNAAACQTAMSSMRERNVTLFN